MTARRVKIENKDEIRKRLGRSPNDGDAIVMCLSEGTRAQSKESHYLPRGTPSGALPCK